MDWKRARTFGLWLLQFFGLSNVTGWISAGGASLAAVEVSTLAEIAGWTTGQKTALLVAVFLLAGGVVRLVIELGHRIYAWLPLPWERAALEREKTSAEERAPLLSFRFEPEMIRATVTEIDLSGLWASAPHVVFVLNVRNASGWPVTLKDVGGWAFCKDNLPRGSARLVDGAKRLNVSAEDCVRIEQPILPDSLAAAVKTALSSPTGTVAFRLADLYWVGTLAGPGIELRFTDTDGEAERKCPVVAETFYVRGPVTETAHAKLMRMETNFASWSWFANSGYPPGYVAVPLLQVIVRNEKPFAPTPEWLRVRLELSLLNHEAESATVQRATVETTTLSVRGKAIPALVLFNNSVEYFNLEVPGACNETKVLLDGELTLKGDEFPERFELTLKLHLSDGRTVEVPIGR